MKLRRYPRLITASIGSALGQAVHLLSLSLLLWVWAELTDVGAHAGPGVNSNDDSMLEDKSERCGPMLWFDVLHDIPLEAIDLHTLTPPSSNWF